MSGHWRNYGLFSSGSGAGLWFTSWQNTGRAYFDTGRDAMRDSLAYSLNRSIIFKGQQAIRTEELENEGIYREENSD